MKTNVFVILSIFFSLVSQSQNEHFCATDLIQKKYFENHPEEKAQFEKQEKLLQKAIQKNFIYKSSEEVYKVPVVIHVMHLGEAVGTGNNISEAQILSGIQQLNDDYRNVNGNGIDMGIEFALAIQDPNGESTTGIIRYNASGLGDYATDGVSVGGGAGYDETLLKAASKWSNDHYYNIWIVSEINGNDGSYGTQGFAYLPGASSTYDGAVIQNTAWGDQGTVNSWNNLGVTITHEMGHGLGLYHTFHVQNAGDTTGIGCPINTNCSTQGDLCCDTDPHTVSASHTCDTAEINPCTGVKYGNVVRNYMDYSDQECQVMFTNDQKDRMRGILETTRKGLLNSRALDQPIAACANPIDASCTPTTGADGLSNYFCGIKEYAFNKSLNISSFSTADQDNGYLDMTGNCLTTSFLNPDSTYKLKLTQAGSNPGYTKAWIDYDNSGSFETGELIFDKTLSGQIPDSVNVLIPTNVTQNEFLRLRVLIDLGSAPSDACDDPQYGQAEDYTVYFYTPGEVTSDVKSLMGIHDLSIFPNPTESVLNVHLDYSGTENLAMFIRDIQGRLIDQKIIPQNLKVQELIDVSNYQNGIYNISIQTSEGMFSQNFLVK